ncbi:MAG: dihydroorotase [Acidobacteriota bacterium]
MTILIQGGKLVDPSQGLDKKTDLLIEKGRIASMGKLRAEDGWKVVDARGWIVAPGFIDMHVHLREPGREDKETIATGTRAAVAAGFTGVACMPNTDPVNDCEAITRYIKEKAREVNLAHVYPVGAVTKGAGGAELSEIGEMVKAGAVALSDDGRPVQNNQIMRRALEYAGIFDIPILDHCEDLNLAARGSMNESAVSTELGLRGINGAAEEMQVARDVVMGRLTGARLHICHLSTRESLAWVRLGKKQGVRITCEVTPHHFTLSDEAVRSYDTNFKVNPPLRSKTDVEALLEGLADGTVDCIATDHAPHTSLDKDVTFEEAACGVVGMESAVPLVWEFLVHKGVISESRAVELLSVNPSRVLKVDGGTLEQGAVADVTLIDPQRRIKIDAARFESKGRNCPYQGWELRGVPMMTIVRGRIVYERKE